MLILNHTPRAIFGYAETPYLTIFGSPLGLGQTCLLPFGFPVIAHLTILVSKLYGRGTESIYLRPSEGELFRSGMFFNVATRRTIIRRSFSPSNHIPFDLFITKDGKRKVVEFEIDGEVCDDQELNEPLNDDIEDPQAGSTLESNVQIPDLVLDNDSVGEDVPVPDLVSDSDSDDEEIDSEKHSWTEVSLSSLTTTQKRKCAHLV